MHEVRIGGVITELLEWEHGAEEGLGVWCCVHYLLQTRGKGFKIGILRFAKMLISQREVRCPCPDQFNSIPNTFKIMHALKVQARYLIFPSGNMDFNNMCLLFCLDEGMECSVFFLGGLKYSRKQRESKKQPMWRSCQSCWEVKMTDQIFGFFSTGEE